MATPVRASAWGDTHRHRQICLVNSALQYLCEAYLPTPTTLVLHNVDSNCRVSCKVFTVYQPVEQLSKSRFATTLQRPCTITGRPFLDSPDLQLNVFWKRGRLSAARKRKDYRQDFDPHTAMIQRQLHQHAHATFPSSKASQSVSVLHHREMTITRVRTQTNDGILDSPAPPGTPILRTKTYYQTSRCQRRDVSAVHHHVTRKRRSMRPRSFYFGSSAYGCPSFARHLRSGRPGTVAAATQL